MQRHDLVSAGIGRGDHGFVVEMAALASEADRNDLEVFALMGDERVALAAHTPRSDAALDLASDARVAVVDAAQYPVFVLGPARSGTSAVALALLQSRRYEGFGEGHLMPLALALLQSASDYYKRFGGAERRDTLIGAVPARVFERMIRRGFTQMTRGKFPSGHWADKSPTVEMVQAAPLMREMYPEAKFLFMKRRVVENFASRRRKFRVIARKIITWTGKTCCGRGSTSGRNWPEAISRWSISNWRGGQTRSRRK